MRPHDGRAIPTFLRQALQDKPLTVFGDGSQTRSFCYVDDQIRGYVAMAESDVHEPVNIGNPDEFTLLELAQVVIEVTESRSEIVYEALPTDDPQVRQPDITRAKRAARLGAAGRAARGPADDDRADRGRTARRRGRLAAAAARLERRLRIAHLTATFPPYPGGAGNTAARFAREQAARGHRVEVFTAPAEGEAPDPGGAEIHRIRPVLAIGNAPLIPSIAAISGFDVVHLHYPFIFGSELTLLGRLSSRRREQALLVHYKNRLVGTGTRGALFEAYEHSVAPLLIRSADRVCVLSPDHAESVPYLREPAARTRRSWSRCRTASMPSCSAPVADEGVRERLGIGDDALVAAFVATLDRAHHFKRVDVAIEALARLGDERLHLVVAGGGELLDGFRGKARGAGVGERVHFLGAVPHSELPGVLRAADLFLLTTEPPESFGIVLIEAMACGLPAIASDYPGVRAVIDEGETGLVVERGDPGAVAAALEELARSGPERRAKMGERGRSRAVAEWSWPRLVDRMDGAYAEAIAVRRRKLGR